MSSPPVTRIATFRFHPSITAAQKANRATAFLALYAAHPEHILSGPRGGKPLDTPLELTGVKRDKVWDMGFVVVFRSEEARRAFDADPGHGGLKDETDPMLEQVFVYDFVEEGNLGW